MMDVNEFARRAEKLSKEIQPLLHGHGRELQGAALADLVSIWLAGHNPVFRESEFLRWIHVVRQMIPESEKEMFGDFGFPEHYQ